MTGERVQTPPDETTSHFFLTEGTTASPDSTGTLNDNYGNRTNPNNPDEGTTWGKVHDGADTAPFLSDEELAGIARARQPEPENQDN